MDVPDAASFPSPPPPGASARIAELRRDLGTALGPIERIFLGAGAHLGEAVDALHSVTEAFDLLADTVDSDGLQAATGAMVRIPDALTAATVANSATSSALHRLDQLAGGLAPPLARLRKTIHEVQVLEVNARIEVGQVARGDIDFSVFTRDIGRLVALAVGELDRLAAELSTLVQATVAARASQDAVDCQQGTALAEVARRLRASAATMAQRRQDAVEAARATRDGARDNAKRVAQAITALQIGDIARQRIEHVDDALATVAAEASGERLGPVCRLQALQLGQTHHELSREIAHACASITALTDEAAATRRQGSERFGSATGGGSFLHQLAADLTVALDLVGGYRDAGQVLRARLEPVAATVADMVARIEAVHSIEADMRIMGLNATLKCGRLGGSGRALGIIAQELRSHAGHTADDAAKVMAGLKEISAVAQSLRHGGANTTPNGEDDVAAILREVVARFTHGGETLDAALALLAHQGESALAHLIQAREALASDGDLMTLLAATADDLGRLADAHGSPDDHAAWTDDLADRYTMASEREVHARFNGSATGPDATATVEVEDFLF